MANQTFQILQDFLKDHPHVEFQAWAIGPTAEDGFVKERGHFGCVLCEESEVIESAEQCSYGQTLEAAIFQELIRVNAIDPASQF